MMRETSTCISGRVWKSSAENGSSGRITFGIEGEHAHDGDALAHSVESAAGLACSKPERPSVWIRSSAISRARLGRSADLQPEHDVNAR